MPLAQPFFRWPAAVFLAPFSRSGLGRIAFAATLLAAGAVGAAEPPPGLSAQPLASRSGPAGRTMFTAMPAERTGIVAENRYADPRMWGDRFPEFTLGAIGTGIAIGDYDNDGRPDVFVVGKTDPCHVFRNLGDWKFADVTEAAGLAPPSGSLAGGLAWVKSRLGGGPTADNDPAVWKQGASFVDVNNDGWLDLYVCRFDAPNLLYVNQRDGTFKEEAAARGLALADASGMAAFCDYDRDGWLDVYVQTNLLDSARHPTGQRDHLFHNNGDGTFTEVTDRAGIAGATQGHSAIWWDYDDDGWPDLYVTDDFSVPDHLYHNNRDGTFSDVIAQVVPHTPFSSMGSDFGDIDNDGRLDYFVPDMAATTHEKDQRGMAASRRLNTEEPPGSAAPSQYARNAVYLNTGAGVCQEVACLTGLAATDWTWSPRFEDLDNDGRIDLHLTNGMVRELHNLDILGRVMVAETPADRIRAVRNGPVLTERNLAFRNLGDLHFEDVSAAWGLDQRGVSFGSAFGDLDGDGDLDLVYANYEGNVTVLRNDCPTGHRLVIALHGTRSNRFGVGASVRLETSAGLQVRTLVLSRGILSSSEPILHFGLGDEATVGTLTIRWPSGATQVFRDVAADRKLTITEPDAPAAPSAAALPASKPAYTEVGAAVGFALESHEPASAPEVAQPLLTLRQNRRGPALALGDLDGDGTDDVVVGGTSETPLRLILARPAAHTYAVAASAVPPSSLDDGPVLVFDADGDGANDLLVTRSGAGLSAGSAEYQPQLRLNDGHGLFRAAPDGALPVFPASVGAAAAVDFDRDGRIDVFVGARVIPGQYPLPPDSALWRNRGGRFEDVTDALAPGLRHVGLVTSALWSDVDGDGWPDLLVATEWGGIRYFHNDAGRGFTDRSDAAGFAAAGTGWWTSLAAADFNGDGRLDYVAGNLGLNTLYHASPERPALLYYGVFQPGSAPVGIEAAYEGDKLYPWLPRKELGAQLPAVLRRFPRNDAYARATLTEILGDDAIASARRFAATEFRSGVFLSRGDGTFAFEPLPRRAQIAPLQGVVAGDFDGDGTADIYAVQNSYSPIPSVGHFDGGVSQLLRGDGHGHFTPVPPADSGLIVRGDAKALVVTDLAGDGRPGFLVSRNNQTTLAFRRSQPPPAGRRALAVTLRAPHGTATAPGARIELEWPDGRRLPAELSAGSGYFSQSGGTAFFSYATDDPPQRVRVRWPSGRETVQDATAWPTQLTLTAPAP